jgi:hypothetical protein
MNSFVKSVLQDKMDIPFDAINTKYDLISLIGTMERHVCELNNSTHIANEFDSEKIQQQSLICNYCGNYVISSTDNIADYVKCKCKKRPRVNRWNCNMEL